MAAPSLRKLKLPDELCWSDDIYLPQIASYSALDDIGQREGVPDMAPRALAGAMLGDYGDAMANCVASAPTLYTAIQRLQPIVKQQDPSCSLSVRLDDDTASVSAQADHMEFHCCAWSGLMLLVSTVKEFAGTEWQPGRISLTSPRPQGFDSRLIFPTAKIIWSAAQTSVSFPTVLLGQVVEEDDRRLENCAPTLSLQAALKGLISAYLPAGSVKLDVIAEMAEIRPRTLQRHLAQLELSFSDLVDQVRFEKASKLLRESDLKSVEIAFETGYTDASHFSRAFRRMAGSSPREYRRQQRQA